MADPTPRAEGLREDDLAFVDQQVRLYEAEMRRQPKLGEKDRAALQGVIDRWRRIRAALAVEATARHEARSAALDAVSHAIGDERDADRDDIRRVLATIEALRGGSPDA